MNGREIALFAARTADDKKCSDIVIYDVHKVSDITDFLVIATAESKAQIRATLESIARDLKECGVRKLGQEGNEGGQWVLLDFSDCVIHIFSPELRDYYGLESLWGDSPKLDWTREPAVALHRVLATGTA